MAEEIDIHEEMEKGDTSDNLQSVIEQTPNEIISKGKNGILIMNIPPTSIFTYEEDMKQLFSEYGEIESIERGGINIYGHPTEPTLTAYIYFVTVEAATKALEVSGKYFNGYPLTVYGLNPGDHSIVIENLPVQMSLECLKNLLAPCGLIKKSIKIPGKQTAFVEFENEAGFNKAMSLNGILLINKIVLSIKKRCEIKPKKVKKGKNQDHQVNTDNNYQQNQHNPSAYQRNNSAAKQSGGFHNRFRFRGKPMFQETRKKKGGKDLGFDNFEDFAGDKKNNNKHEFDYK